MWTPNIQGLKKKTFHYGKVLKDNSEEVFMKTLKMTVGQALTTFLDNQYVNFDGKEYKFVEGVFAIFGHGNVVGFAKKLFCHLAAAFTDSHGSKSTVTGMAVRTQNHLPTASHLLPHILVENRCVRRKENAAVFLDISHAKNVIVLIDGTSHGT